MSRAFVRLPVSRFRKRSFYSRQLEAALEALHDLQSPLTGVVAAWEYFREHVIHPNDESYVGLLELAIQRIEAIIDDGLGQLRNQHSTVIDMNKLCCELADEYGFWARKEGVTLMFVPCEWQVLVMGQQDRLRRALSNLVSNALRASSKNGEVRIEVRATKNQVALLVSDTGRGISVRKFNRFAAGKAVDGARAGIGLAQVRNVLEAHKAKWSIGYRKEGGTCIKLFFARAHGHPAYAPDSTGV
ncbi:MAG: HAMP domain-containing histidine kinase [Deltaproteobacteria bacterium]|nr:HAMP domain-containing histidine kinase [Deltaproteobacteria bacterium]